MPDSLLIPSAFSNKTGFAWTAFFKLFDHVAEAFHERGFNICLSFAKIEGEVEILSSGVPHVDLLFDPNDITFAATWNLLRQVRRHRIRYVYWTDFPTCHWIFALLRTAGVKRIVIHSHISVADPKPARPEAGIRRIIKTMIHRTPILRADQVLACSQFVKDRLVNKACCPADLITVIHYGLPSESFDIKEARSKPLSEPLVVFCASRAIESKGVHILIQATELLLAEDGIPDFVVEYAGAGPGLEAFKKLAASASLGDRFRFLGYLSDVSSRLREADIIVIPSIWGDAFPYSVLEAMAMSKSVIATRAGGIPEEIGDDSCGVLIEPNDPVALAKAMADLLRDEDRRDRLGRNAGRRAREKFREEDYFRAVVDHLSAAFDVASPPPR